MFLLLAVSSLPSCRTLPPQPAPESTPTPEVVAEEPSPTPTPEDLPVKKVKEEIVVAAWAEPSELPPGGGMVQILVRVQKKGGRPFPGVEVRLATSKGTLYSRSGILTTDARGMTRDRLTTRRSAKVTLNAGGTRYTFRVPVGEDSDT